jgi:hypothetical protein
MITIIFAYLTLAVMTYIPAIILGWTYDKIVASTVLLLLSSTFAVSAIALTLIANVLPS